RYSLCHLRSSAVAAQCPTLPVPAQFGTCYFPVTLELFPCYGRIISLLVSLFSSRSERHRVFAQSIEIERFLAPRRPQSTAISPWFSPVTGKNASPRQRRKVFPHGAVYSGNLKHQLLWKWRLLANLVWAPPGQQAPSPERALLR